ncbi:MAG: WG repeat-containing protein [Chitinophagaceae bacterium]|nr:WG repeat-containing protein [Chitinophagaceae bacterium]
MQVSSTSAPQLADKTFKKIKDLNTNFQGPYSEGLAYANNLQTGNIYYLDKKGNEVFSISAKEGSKCVGGLITVKDKTNRYFLVDKTGKPVNSLTWDAIGIFSDGLALVKNNSKWGYIDAQGNKVIDTKYDIGSGFTKGAAIVKLNNQFFLINKKGEPINSNKYDAAGAPDNGTFPVQKDSLTGLIDSKGNTLIDFKKSYNSLLYMSEERAWASQDGKWGLLDNTGKALTDFMYDGALSFKNGYAVVMLDDKYGLINKAGKLVVPAEYKSLGSIYKNTMLGIRAAETVFYNLK